MLEKNCIDFINNNIDMETFQQLCRETYCKYISSKDLKYDLDAIKCLPFIHSFAYFEQGASVDEYKKEVCNYIKLLHYEVEYHYSCVILLPKLKNDYLDNFDDELFIERISCLFRDVNKTYENILDLLYNMLQELIYQYLNNKDDCFDSINCADELNKEHLRDRILQLFMYYAGKKEFMVQLFCNKSEKDVFCII